ncbi:MAG: acyl carrier protein [Oscillatoriaceae cyanobacterium Prado104]|jgi:acyl carrier protein|nr:acyl carrier protein [Oscillatoriaceae cyanobacterium Prado104]
MHSVEDLLRQHIAENILFSTKGYPYPDEASFLENGIIDSMNVIELVMFLEENLGIKIEDTEIVPDNFDSVSSLAKFARRKQSLVTAPAD